MVTFGFYDTSPNNVREYDAEQVSEMFDGIITDGVYMHIGDRLMVSAAGRLYITVGTGRAWFNHTWTKNDAPLVLKIPDPNIVFPRIDIVALEVDSRITKVINTIKIIEGVPAQTPVAKALVKADDVYQYPLAYVYVAPAATEITQSVITNAVGTSECPFVTGVLQGMSIDALVAQWKDQWTVFYDTNTKKMTSDWETLYSSIVGLLGKEPATNLAMSVMELQQTINDQNIKINNDLVPKINQAVQNSNTALSTANIASSTASQANTKVGQLVGQIGDLKFVKTTKAAYDALTNKDSNTVYLYPI